MAEKSKTSSASSKHEVTWKFTPLRPASGGYGRHHGTCSCGTQLNQRWGSNAFRSNQNKQLSKDAKRAAWRHIQAQDTSSHGAPMRLVGQIIKKRVTNEVWVMSAYGDLPEEIPLGDLKDDDWAKSAPWLLVYKNSKGWITQWTPGRYNYFEQAYAAGLQILQDAYIEGHGVEVASRIDMDTIEVPFAGVEKYLTDLVDKAKAIRIVSRDIRSMTGNNQGYAAEPAGHVAQESTRYHEMAVNDVVMALLMKRFDPSTDATEITERITAQGDARDLAQCDALCGEVVPVFGRAQGGEKIDLGTEACQP